jgi:hypothetical protein
MSPTEGKVQRAMFKPLADRGYSHVTPNVHLYGWESDVVAITSSGYLVEYEIKLSRSDFQRDRRKSRHAALMKCYKGSKGKRSGSVPSRFLYATTPGLVSPNDLPEYAGLTYVSPDGLDKQESAPRLTKSKARKSHRTTLAKSLMWDAWLKGPVGTR